MEQSPETKKNWHDRHYKTILIIPVILIILSFAYISIFYSQNGDFVHRDISLTGGTSVTIYDQINVLELQQVLQPQLNEINIREISDLITNEQKAIVIETKSDGETAKKFLEDYLGYELNEENSSFEFTGSSLSEGFYRQLLIAILIAFIFMGIVIFIIFRNFIPSIAVIISAFANILMTLAVVDLFGLRMSSAGIIAFLLLIGYSVDTDILLTTRVLKRRDDSLNARISSAFKTGMTMTLTSLFAFLVALLIVQSYSNTLTQILTILCIGLGFDLINTWITNVSILKWYIKRKNE